MQDNYTIIQFKNNLSVPRLDKNISIRMNHNLAVFRLKFS